MTAKYGRIYYIILALIISSLMAGCGNKPALDDVEREKRVPVVTAIAQVEDLSVYQSFPGNVIAIDEVSLTPKMGGKVEQVLVREGDQVKAGQPIIVLEQKDAAQQLAQAQAGYNAASAQLKNLKDGQLPQQIAQLESGLKQAEANFKNVQDNYDRMKGLLDEGAISIQQYEGIELQYNVAKEQYETTKTQLTLLQETTAPESIAAVEAQVEQTQAMLALAKSGFDSTVISSPIDGTVGAIGAKEGQLVSPGMPVATVGNFKSVEIEISVTEDRINGIVSDQTAEVTVDAAGTEVLLGKVFSVSPFKDPRTKVYPVKIIVPNEEGFLKSGMFARARLTTAVYPQVVTVPEDAIVFRGGRNVVYILDGDKVKSADVEIGPTSLGKTLVQSGISSGDQIVVEGQEMLQDNAKVVVEGRGDSK